MSAIVSFKSFIHLPRTSAATAIAILVIMALMIRPPKIESRIDDLNIKDNPYTLSGAKMAETFGSRNLIQIVVKPDAVDHIQPFSESVEVVKDDLENTFPGMRVETINRALPLIYRQVSREATVREAFTAALDIPVARNLISSDTTSVLLVVFADRAENFDLTHFDSVIDKHRSTLQVTAVISQPHIEKEVENSIISDYFVMLPVIMGFFFVILFLSYRSITAVLFCILNMLLSFIPSMFFITLFGVNINQVTAPAIPVVVILSLSASVHLITGFRFRSHNPDLNTRITDTLHHYLVPTFLSVLTTSVSFGSFYLSDSLYIRQFGLVAACSLMVVFVITFLLAPFVLQFVRVSKPAGSKMGFMQTAEEFLNRFRKPITIAFFTITAVSVFYINDITFRTNIETYIPVNSRVYHSVHELNTRFHSIAALDIMVESTRRASDTLPGAMLRKDLLQVISSLTDSLQKDTRVLAVESVLDQLEFEDRFFIPGMRAAIFPRSNNPYVSQDQQKYRIHVKLSDPEDAHRIEADLQQSITKYEEHFDFSIYSDYLYFGFISEGITRSLLRSLLVSALLIVLIIFLLTRSIQKTFISILVNTIPLGFMVLILVIFGVDMNITTSLSLVLCLGLIVDDTIQILYRRVRLSEPLGELGFGVLTTSIIVTGGFLSFLLSTSLPTRVFGLICAAVFIVAAISDMTVMQWMLRDEEK